MTLWRLGKFKNKDYDIQEAGERFGRPTDVDEPRLRELLDLEEISIQPLES